MDELLRYTETLQSFKLPEDYDELRDHFPVHVVVEKMPGGSRVSVR